MADNGWQVKKDKDGVKRLKKGTTGKTEDDMDAKAEREMSEAKYLPMNMARKALRKIDSYRKWENREMKKEK